MCLLPILVFLLHIALSIAAQPAVECVCDGGCTRSKGRCEYDRIEECYPYSGTFLNDYFSHNALGSEISAGHCSTTVNQSDIRLQDLTVKYVSVNPRYVSICASWTLDELSGSSGGYRVKFSRAYRQPMSVCISNSSSTSVCLNNIEYEALQFYEMKVQVLPHPLDDDDDESMFGITRELRTDIRGCADVEPNKVGCIKRYGKPQDLSVLSTLSEDSTKNLSISWDHVKDMPIPDAYFVELYDRSRKFLNINFKVVDATEIILSNLDGDVEYYARVQAYSRCAGLGRYDFNSNTLGCGRGRRKLEENAMV